jgi:hypothetical protein
MSAKRVFAAPSVFYTHCKSFETALHTAAVRRQCATADKKRPTEHLNPLSAKAVSKSCQQKSIFCCQQKSTNTTFWSCIQVSPCITNGRISYSVTVLVCPGTGVSVSSYGGRSFGDVQHPGQDGNQSRPGRPGPGVMLENS